MGWVLRLLVGYSCSSFRELSNRPLRMFCQIVARYSYGIYLTHFVCIWFAFVKLRGLPGVEVWLIFVTTTIASPVIHHLIEAPMMKVWRIGVLVGDADALRGP